RTACRSDSWFILYFSEWLKVEGWLAGGPVAGEGLLIFVNEKHYHLRRAKNQHVVPCRVDFRFCKEELRLVLSAEKHRQLAGRQHFTRVCGELPNFLNDPNTCVKLRRHLQCLR
ncbi:hypothetical protein, partial [Noviherbaspirillum denitrificans]|uniref:hypothetical protein n=1 Tax=Noviherbaspirillum denitrificans TaxID=1968433 RepID=UPI00197CC10B